PHPGRFRWGPDHPFELFLVRFVIPWYWAFPPASFRSHLAMTPPPPASGGHLLFSQGTYILEQPLPPGASGTAAPQASWRGRPGPSDSFTARAWHLRIRRRSPTRPNPRWTRTWTRSASGSSCRHRCTYPRDAPGPGRPVRRRTADHRPAG